MAKGTGISCGVEYGGDAARFALGIKLRGSRGGTLVLKNGICAMVGIPVDASILCPVVSSIQ